MADVKNNQVIDNLKRKFKNGSHIVFWYDDNAEFADELDNITAELKNLASVVILQKGEQLKLKLKLLSAPSDENFLVYSPSKQPSLDDNHLRDIILYSDTFTADAQEMIRRDLRLPEKLKSFVKLHAKFFASKERRSKFAKYDLGSYVENPEMGILATLVNSNRIIVNFFDILQIVLSNGIYEKNILDEFAKYNVLDNFWDYANQMFDYNESEPNLLNLSSSLFITEAFHQMDISIPDRIGDFDLSSKYPNVSTFVRSFSSSNVNNGDKFRDVADEVWAQYGEKYALLKNTNVDQWSKSDIFSILDRKILLWEQDRLLHGDFDSRTDGLTFPELVKKRLEMHYVSEYRVLYQMLQNAWKLLSSIGRKTANSTEGMINDYINEGYLIDTYYRHFVLSYQALSRTDAFFKIREAVEAAYTNEYLNTYNFSWTDKLNYRNLSSRDLQRNFYRNYIETEQNRIVVIISDAFRFEAAKELEQELSMDDQIVERKMKYLISELPSVTYMGMPSLLPNDNLKLVGKNLLVDGKEANNREKRAQILISKNPNSAAYALDDLKDATSKKIKSLFAGKEIVYIYHNQIDAIADNKKTEDDVFKATADAIREIKDLIGRLRTNSINHFYITADHGYIYRNENLKESDKISEDVAQDDLKSQRYIVTENQIDEPGIGEQKLGDILDNDDNRFVYYPQSANIFKSAGSVNYVHGGASLQEMVVPLLEVKTTSKRSQAVDVELQLISTNRNITSLEVPIRLLQAKAVDSTYRPTVYNVYFQDINGELISAKTSVNANLTFTKVEDRMIDLNINLIDKQYNNTNKYYFVVENTNTGDVIKNEYSMDIATFRDFDF
ncbi:BREX-1 system phosphatase PglZ type A [Companilactobacillus paralimentarius]|uniref:BREX-1 system phosphatase PglZ type A n=1 Tax=Companilactobacillus paralimentarius TaxID=83526 RepID=UPI00384BE17F